MIEDILKIYLDIVGVLLDTKVLNDLIKCIALLK